MVIVGSTIEQPNNNYVVQAQPVQAQPVQAIPLQGQPVMGVVAGNPQGVAPGTVVGSPMGAPYPGSPYHQQPVNPDQRGAQIGWVAYFVGWLLCCCCGPVGPIFWFGVACMYYSKPKEQRDQLYQERQVAQVSLVTGCCCCIIVLAIIVAIVVAIANGDIDWLLSDCTSLCSNYQSYLDQPVCLDYSSGYCSTPKDTSTDEEAQACSGANVNHCHMIGYCDYSCQNGYWSSGDLICQEHATYAECSNSCSGISGRRRRASSTSSSYCVYQR